MNNLYKNLFINILNIILSLLLLIIYLINTKSNTKSKSNVIVLNKSINTKYGKYTLSFIDTFNDLNNWNIQDGLDKLTNTCAKYDKTQIITDTNGVHLKFGPKIDDTKNIKKICCGNDPSGKKHCNDSCLLAPRMTSHFSQKYGLFMFTAKVPKGKDLFPALWLSTTNDWPKGGEIDIMETINTHKNRPNFTSRIMVPIDSDFLTKNSKNYYVGVSVPPDDKPDDLTFVNDSFWNDFHVYALDWYVIEDNVYYDFYLDVELNINGDIINISDNQKATPIKRYNLKDLVNTYKSYKPTSKYPPQYNLTDYTKIRDAVEPLHLVMNIAIGGAWDNKCGGNDCSQCNNESGEMIVKKVEVWK